MQDWDLISVRPVLLGSSTTVAGTIIGIMLPGVQGAFVPFLLLTIAVLVVLSTALFVFSNPGSPLPI